MLDPPRRRRLLLACGLATCAASLPLSPLDAHDIWIVSNAPGTETSAEIVFGDLIGPSLADVKRIVSFDLVTTAGRTDLRPLLAEAKSNGHPVLKTKPFAAVPGALVAVTYDNGFWVRLPQDKLETNTNPLLAPNAEDPHWTVKWGKELLGPGAYRMLLNTRLELIAMKDPFSAKAGSKLPVKVMLDGKPLAGADIAYTDGIEPLPDPKQPVAKSGADGIAQVPVPRAGPVLLTTDLMAPAAHPSLAKQDHLYASIAYDTSH
ncbi:MAG: DUF4198 domain-containing protein [Sphingomonadaceae bacterium]|nr:DUF4198 domain-containing protein [Sphingomonadaceae bacterium]